VRRILAIARKEFLHIVRDKRTLVAVLVMPLLQLFLFAYAVSFDVKDIPTAVLDQDRSAQSRSYIASLQQSNYFRVTQNLTAMRQVDGVFARSEDSAIVILPPGFGDAVAAGRAGEVQVLIDGSEPNSAQIGQAYATGLSRVHGVKVAIDQAATKGMSLTAGGLSALTRVWYNPEGSSSAFLVPGLIVLLLTITTIQQTANTLVREKEQGSYEQLVVSPIRRIELMVGKVMPWAGIAALQIVVITIIGLTVFQIPFRGSVLLFGISSIFFVVCCLGLGLLISARSSSIETANQMAMMVSFLPAFMLSGFIFPLTSVPWVLQLVSYLFPARYFMVITRTLFLKGGGLEVLWPQVLSLGVYAVVVLVLSSLLYRERA
jgi:ABC-2 type transport system permease protein